MIEIGTVVKGAITRVEPFGIFLRHGVDQVFVPASNIAWKLTPETIGQFRAGDERDVFIERMNYDKNVYSGSFKHLDPEGNPYRALSRHSPSTVFHGVVKMLHANGITVEIEGGCLGDLPVAPATNGLTEGMNVDVRIRSLEIDAQNLLFDLAATVPS